MRVTFNESLTRDKYFTNSANTISLPGRTTEVFLNPGFRWAVCQKEVEWVLGVAVPIGLTKDAPAIGVFAYMSIEFDIRKKE